MRTDHNSLKWLYSFREPEGQVAWWLETIAEYDFSIIHRPGTKHTNADALSQSNHEHTDISQHCRISHYNVKQPSEIQAAQRQDPKLLSVATWLEKDAIRCLKFAANH